MWCIRFSLTLGLGGVVYCRGIMSIPLWLFFHCRKSRGAQPPLLLFSSILLCSVSAAWFRCTSVTHPLTTPVLVFLGCVLLIVGACISRTLMPTDYVTDTSYFFFFLSSITNFKIWFLSCETYFFQLGFQLTYVAGPWDFSLHTVWGPHPGTSHTRKLEVCMFELGDSNR